MQKQEILGVKLTLKSEGGIRPLMDYHGRGRLSKNSDGFLFVERPTHKRIRNTRVAKSSEGNFIMHQTQTGMFKLQLLLTDEELTQRAIIEKVKPLLAELKEGGWV